jgi:pyruvate dehydrogenase (quinone)
MGNACRRRRKTVLRNCRRRLESGDRCTAAKRKRNVDFVHVRNEEYGVFAAVADAYFTGAPVVVCGTAGPDVVHLFNRLMDALKKRAPVIAIAGDAETGLMDTSALEEMNPYQFFQAASLYTGRLVNPAQAQAVIGTAIRTSIIEKGPTVLSIPRGCRGGGGRARTG